MTSQSPVVHAPSKLHTLRQYIHQCIVDFRGELTGNQVWSIAGNVTFLVRYNYGPDINIDHVSVPVINFLAQYDRPAQRIYVIFQKDLERFRDILSVDTEEGQNIIECLKKEVDKMIMYIMGYETTANSHIDSGKE